MKRLKKCGMKSILDYCVEADISSDNAGEETAEGAVEDKVRIEV